MIKTNITFVFDKKKFQENIGVVTVAQSVERLSADWGVACLIPGAGPIDPVTVFHAILASRQTREKLQWLYENLMSNNFRRTAVLKKIWFVN